MRNLRADERISIELRRLYQQYGRRGGDSASDSIYIWSTVSHYDCHGGQYDLGGNMLTYLYEWIENIAFYMVIITVAMQMIPNSSYKKYIRFFTGLILIIMLSGPIMKIFGMEQELQEFYKSAEYQQKVKEIERATKYLEEFSGEIE